MLSVVLFITLSDIMFSIKFYVVILSVPLLSARYAEGHCVECDVFYCYVECMLSFTVLWRVILLSVAMLSVKFLNVMLSVVMLSILFFLLCCYVVIFYCHSECPYVE